MKIEDICIHEAAHALVYDALNIRLKKVWIEENSDGVSWGMAERGTSPDDLAPALLVLGFMAGAAALVHLTPLPIDRVIKKTTNDFCTALKYLGRLSTPNPRETLQWLERATWGFVSQWTTIHRQVIVGLASELQRRRVRHGRSELGGMHIHEALAANWKEKPSRAAVIAFAETGWAAVQKTNLTSTESSWHAGVLASYAAMNHVEGDDSAGPGDFTEPIVG